MADNDPVDELRQALRPDRQPTDKPGYDARKKNLMMKVDKLDSIVDLSRALVLTDWATAFIGTGLLSSIPGSVLLLTQMGILLRLREPRPNP